MTKLQVTEASSEFACGTFGPLAIAVWEVATTQQTAETAARMLRMLGTSRSEIYLLAILSPETPPPTNEARDIMSAAVRDLGAKVQASANVVEGTGFRAAAMRAALLGMNMIMRASHTQKAFATVGEAAAYLAEQSNELEERAVINAVTQLRRQR